MKDFFNFIKSFFSNSPEEKLKREIRSISNGLSKTLPPTLDAKKRLVTASFAYHLHNTLRPLIALFPTFRVELEEKKAADFVDQQLKEKITPEVLKKIDIFKDEESILKASQEESMTEEELSKKFNEAFKLYQTSITPEIKNHLTNCVKNISLIAHLRKFDPVAFFKEFDKNYKTTSSPGILKFNPKEVELLADDFKIIDSVIHSLSFNKDLQTSLLSYYKYLEKDVDNAGVKKILKNLYQLKSNDTLKKLIIVATKNLNYVRSTPMPLQLSLSHQIETHMQAKKQLMEEVYKKKRSVEAKNLQEKLFGSAKLPNLLGYCKTKKTHYEESVSIEVFKYESQISIIYAFIELLYKERIKPLTNLIIIRGNFDQESDRKEVNDAFFNIDLIVSKVEELEKKLLDEGDYTLRINRFLMSKNAGDGQQGVMLIELFETIDAEAKSIVQESIIHFKKIYTAFSTIIETNQQQSRRYLRNIQDFAGAKTSLLINNKIKGSLQEVKMFFNLLRSKN